MPRHMSTQPNATNSLDEFAPLGEVAPDLIEARHRRFTPTASMMNLSPWPCARRTLRVPA